MSSSDSGVPDGQSVQVELSSPGVENGVPGIAHESAIFGLDIARIAWKEAAGFATLFGVLFYGVGRLLTDSFYGRLGTTADLAGVGTLPILEPAVVAAAILAIVATIIMILPDVISSSVDWTGKLLLGGGLVILTGGVTILVRYGIFAVMILLIVLMPALVNRMRKLGKSSPGPRIFLVVASLVLLVGACVIAHATGVQAADNVEEGEAVHLNFLGLDISSISATRVQIRAIDTSVVIEQLAADPCLLQIGSGPSDILLYDSTAHQTLGIPSSEVEVVTPSASPKNHCDLLAGN